MLFIRTTDLVQRLQVAHRDLELEAAISKLDKYHLLILDDIAYVTKDQDKTMTLAVIDRFVHHATIVEMNIESYRRKAALKRKRGKGD